MLFFSSCTALSNIADFGLGVGTLQGLKDLQLKFRSCTALSDIADLARGVGKLQGLWLLDLEFSGCSALTETLRRNFRSRADFLAAVEL
jgi:hypothetical protein